MRTIGVVTVGRSDYSYYVPVLRRMAAERGMRAHLIVSGMHLVPEFGRTEQSILRDGFPIGDRVEMLVASDTPEGVAKSIGLGAIGFAQSYARCRPDILLVLGDRFEMFSAVVAALPMRIPVAHVHGGELTEGAMDDAVRHSITKMSHLHFVATEEYARRVTQLGEEPERVIVSGAPSLDNLRGLRLSSRAALEKRHGLRLQKPFLLATFHPVTLEYEQTEQQITEFLAALDHAGLPVVFTYPNADMGSRLILEKTRRYVAQHRNAWIIANLGTGDYFSMMKYAAAMIGNSSSGIIEAASFRLPVVNVGNRQRGRVRGKNVQDVECRRGPIAAAIREATSASFLKSLANLVNPYGDGRAAERIVARLKAAPLDGSLIQKRFFQS